jgi:hypothetical protein
VSVNGGFNPLIVKPVPPTEACEILTLTPPELVRVSESCWLLPTWTSPKLRLEGLGASEPGARPFPNSGTLRLAFDALLMIARFPLLLPAEDGVKVTLKPWLCPDVSVNGKLNPLTL